MVILDSFLCVILLYTRLFLRSTTICQFLNYWKTLSNSLVKLFSKSVSVLSETVRFVPSACIDGLDFSRQFGQLFMYNKKRSGPRFVPWRILHCIVLCDDITRLILNLYIRLFKYDFNQDRTALLMLYKNTFVSTNCD